MIPVSAVTMIVGTRGVTLCTGSYPDHHHCVCSSANPRTGCAITLYPFVTGLDNSTYIAGGSGPFC